jgi:hypothetical protein
MGPTVSYVVKFLLPILALGVSVWAIIEARLARGTAKAALEENKRQHTTGLQPSVGVRVEMERGPHGEYSVVYVCNDGPGVAIDVEYALDISWPSPPPGQGRKSRNRLGSLAVRDRHRVTQVRYSGVRAWGTITAKDVEGREYWWAQPHGDAPMQSGTGPLPSDG